MYAKYEKKKTKKAINYWNYYTKEHFERLAEAIQKGEEELGGNQSNAASSAQQVSTVVESDIKTCSSTFSQDKYKLRKETVIHGMVTRHWDTTVNLVTKKILFITLKYASKVQSLDSTGEIFFEYLEIF
ncbi:hypothetical protein K501DRAFT_270062 [Backusella circina FSU 941]|nr:hypothetical protein K501DRAFT_270062 [Backusella circina FSU 941]